MLPGRRRRAPGVLHLYCAFLRCTTAIGEDIAPADRVFRNREIVFKKRRDAWERGVVNGK